MIKEKIQNLLYQVFLEIKKENNYSFNISKKNIEIITQEISNRGDYSSNLPFIIAKNTKQKPQEIAELIKNKIIKKETLFLENILAENGFLNFFVKKEFLLKEFKNFLNKKNKKASPKKGKIIIDFSSPNIAKPMHVGHLRSTLLGDALAKLFEFFGFQVIRWNFLGDWGTQFGKLIVAFKLWGEKEKLNKNPVKYLLRLYQKFHQEVKNNPNLEKEAQKEFALLEKGEKNNQKLFNLFKKLSLKEFEKIYKILNIKFDLYLGESFFFKDQQKLINLLEKKNLLKKSEGALIVDLEEFNLPPALIFKTDEAGLYLTRDLCALIYRIKKYQPQKILYVVGNEQNLHFKQLFAIAKKIKINKCELIHVKFGLTLTSEKKKLSTREGELILLEDLLEKAFEKSLKILKEKHRNWSENKQKKVAQKIALSLIKFNTLKTYRLNDVIFDWENLLDFKGKTSVYLQYTFARLNKILEKAKKIKINFKNQKIELGNELELKIIKKIFDFDQNLKYCLEQLSFHPLANYLLSLADLLNQYYETVPILKEKDIIKQKNRLFLIKQALDIFDLSFRFLGIEKLKEI